MASHRTERVGERIHQELSVMFGREISDPRLYGINITRVEVTGDLRLAKVYVAPRKGDEPAEQKEMMDALKHAAGYFRRALAQSMDMRYTPELRFYLDHSIEMGEHFIEVLNQVQAEEQEREDKPNP